jgi:hypothetical protein
VLKGMFRLPAGSLCPDGLCSGRVCLVMHLQIIPRTVRAGHGLAPLDGEPIRQSTAAAGGRVAAITRTQDAETVVKVFLPELTIGGQIVAGAIGVDVDVEGGAVSRSRFGFISDRSGRGAVGCRV